MLKKRLHIALSVILCCFTALGANAQASIVLTESNIASKTDVSLTAVSIGNYTPALVEFNSAVGVKSSTNNFPATTTGTSMGLNLNVARVKLSYFGGINLGGTATEVTLTNGNQTIYANGVTLGTQALRVDYKIVTAGNAWLAGIYSTTLNYSPADGRLSAPNHTLQITVPGFITLNSAATTSSIHLTTLADFRNAAGLSVSNDIDYYASVPTLLDLKSTGSTFTLVPLISTAPLPTANANLLSAAVASPAGPSVNLSTTDQLLTIAAGIPVIADNRRTVSTALSISKANLNSGFARAGTYSLPMVYTLSKPTSAYPTTLASKTVNHTFQVIVDNMSEITLPTATVLLDVSTQNAYKLGLTATVPNQIKLSSTFPYNVTVKASSSNFTSSGGDLIPVGVIIIEGMAGQTGVTPVTLSTTAQPLVSSAGAEIDRILNLQYRIPAAQTTNLLNKPQGNYTTNIIYTLAAP